MTIFVSTILNRFMPATIAAKQDQSLALIAREPGEFNVLIVVARQKLVVRNVEGKEWWKDNAKFQHKNIVTIASAKGLLNDKLALRIGKYKRVRNATVKDSAWGARPNTTVNHVAIVEREAKSGAIRATHRGL